MAVTTSKTNKPILPRGADVRPIDSYNRAELYSGKALDFDGVNDYVDCGTLDVTAYTAISVAMYLSKETTSTQLPFSLRHTGGDDIRIVTESNNVQVVVDDGTAYTLSHIVPLSTMLFVVLTFDGSTLKGYVNGNEFGSMTASFDFSTADGALRIGERVNGSLDFNGQIANTKVFTTALTAEQVADLYNNPEKVVPTGVADSALKLWLPMMEGAGTTAYDGSGNGNHGTINGATWQHGIGSPVAQTAVIDWNKLYDFDGNDLASNGSYVNTSGTKTYKVHFNSHDVTRADQQIFQFWNNTAALGMSGTINFLGTNSGVFGIRGYGSGVSFDNTSWSGLTDNTFYELEFTIDWGAESITSATLNGVASDGSVSARLDTTNNGLYLGARINTFHLVGIINYFEVVGEDKWTNASGFKSESGSYDMTISGSPTQILAPQGLTTGRDITGVNLFENVRKQGALNLDGKSWAEVHDNESLDFGTGSFTLEAWVKGKFVSQGSVFNAIITLGGNVISSNNAALMVLSDVRPYFIYSNVASLGSAQTEGDWLHMVGTYDETNTTLYVNGLQVDQDARTAANMTNEFAKVIGRDGTDPNRYYNDQIAQPRIYNRALTASEALNNYNVTKDLYI
jgi:hypothetical protein